jgi:uncharacterized protein YijF (DUF1287 family)
MRLPLMTTRRWMVAAAVVVILLGFGFCLISQARTGMQIAFADEQTAIFDEMRRQTGEAVAVDVTYLEYALWYYPSGTKQTNGSGLDRVVERARQCAVREIMEILRSRTRKDFGDDPRRWIEGLRAEGIGGRGRAPDS